LLKERTLAAVRQSGWALQGASEAHKDDKDIVLAAVRQNGLALVCASKELQNDKHIVLEAVKQSRFALEHASEALRKEFQELAEIKDDAKRAEACDELLRNLTLANDKDIVLAVVKQNGYTLRYTNEGLRYRDIILAAVQQNGYALEYTNNSHGFFANSTPSASSVSDSTEEQSPHVLGM